MMICVRAGEVDIGMFDKLQATLEKEMSGDILPRFIKSNSWFELVRVELEIEDAKRIAQSCKQCVTVRFSAGVHCPIILNASCP